ncbi:MAG: hypothetical protein Q8K20_16245 [Gemmobacter sp.]|jgi:hypothetical protein|nr:hypothetical protein [Gemmobacter sp.]
MLIDKYRKVWVFALRLRRGSTDADYLVYLRYIARNDTDPKVRAMAARQLSDLEKAKDSA